MKRRVFVGGAFAGAGITGAYASAAKVKPATSHQGVRQDRRQGAASSRKAARAWTCILQ